MHDTLFRRFNAEVDGEVIGASVLNKEWSSDDVLLQLRTDGCPVGENCVVEGWPSENFKVVRQDGKIIKFRFSPQAW